MTPYQFNQLDEMEQAEAVWNGVLVIIAIFHFECFAKLAECISKLFKQHNSIR
jgi:hypothetical protein